MNADWSSVELFPYADGVGGARIRKDFSITTANMIQKAENLSNSTGFGITFTRDWVLYNGQFKGEKVTYTAPIPKTPGNPGGMTS